MNKITAIKNLKEKKHSIEKLFKTADEKFAKLRRGTAWTNDEIEDEKNLSKTWRAMDREFITMLDELQASKGNSWAPIYEDIEKLMDRWESQLKNYWKY